MYDVATMARVSIAFAQINLQHCKSASAVLARRVSKQQTGIALVQEPWLNKGNISGLRTCGQCFSANRPDARAACILVKGVRSDVWAKYCGIPRDLTTVVIHCSSKKGIERRVLVCSAYFPSDAKKDLIGDCEAEGLNLVIVCDGTSHHSVWGSSDCNIRAKTLLEFLEITKLGILDVDGKPTFKNSIREEVLDISLTSGRVASKIRSWRVSDEISMSDHRHITLELTDLKPEIKSYGETRGKQTGFGFTGSAEEPSDHVGSKAGKARWLYTTVLRP